MSAGSPWRSIVALNAASAMAQLGQYGVAFMLYPLALEAQGVPAWQIGIASSAGWLGMLLGLVLAPRAIERFGQRRSVVAGLALSALALLGTPGLPHAAWPFAAAASGFGMGLRWIGNETWLYAIAPGGSRGRVVGVHEALLGIAAVAGPALIAAFGVERWAPFALAAAATALAALPLAWADARLLAVRVPRLKPEASPGAPRNVATKRWKGRLPGLRLISLGALIAAAGGLIEGGLLAAFPVYASDAGFASSEAAWLLTVFGAGAMLLQFPLGWLADARGLHATTLVAAAATALSAAVLGMAALGSAALAGWMFLLGGASTGFLTLGIVAATQQADPDRMVVEVSRVSVAYTGASIIGPLVVGALVSGFGSGALMVFTGLAALALGAAVVGQRLQRDFTTA